MGFLIIHFCLILIIMSISQLTFPLLQNEDLINNFMHKEKLPKFYKKPQLSLICPSRLLVHATPAMILTQPLKQYNEQSEIQLQQTEPQNLHKDLPKYKKSQATTCMEWFVNTDHKMGEGSQHQKDQKRQISDRFKKSSQIQRKTQSFFKRRRSHEQRRLLVNKNSPYVKNQQQYQRILNNLRPVKGPTQSLMKQIKKHNQQNKKNTQNVLLATKESFKDKIMKYSSRIGLSKDEKIFIMNSKDIHIRQTLQRNGWVESNDISSTFFHLKWVYTDLPGDYTKLQQGQFYNHFKNNQQLTNKNLFRKNVYKCASYLQPNYPKTFDLESNEDQVKFEIQYSKYEYYHILSKIYEFVTKNQTLNAYYLKAKKMNCLGLVRSKNWCFGIEKGKQRQFSKCLEPIILKQKGNQQCRQLRELLYALCFILQQFCESSKQKNSNKHTRKLSLINTSNQINSILRVLKTCLKYFLYDQKQQINQFAIQESLNQSYQQFKSKTNETAKNLERILVMDKYLLVYLMVLYKKLSPKFKHNFGVANWWIIKPAGVSRGTGIKIQQDLSKLISNKYGKIVQKYIERPLLLSCGRKFDIRQWVLVRSFVPLEAYLFQRCYCRFSAQKYMSDNFETLSVHLTNYSKQKESFQKRGNGIESSIKSEQQLQQQIQRQTFPGKWTTIKKQIKQQIVKSLKCCQYEIEDKKQCFEVFGFDIILDEEYKPWVLEVNMSPACERRSNFLSNYLTKMAQGIIDLVEDRQIRYWQKLQDNQQSLNNYKTKQKIKLDKFEAACIIQHFYRKKLKNNIKKSQQHYTEIKEYGEDLKKQNLNHNQQILQQELDQNLIFQKQ